MQPQPGTSLGQADRYPYAWRVTFQESSPCKRWTQAISGVIGDVPETIAGALDAELAKLTSRARVELKALLLAREDVTVVGEALDVANVRALVDRTGADVVVCHLDDTAAAEVANGLFAAQRRGDQPCSS